MTAAVVAEDNRIELAVYDIQKQFRIYHVGVLVRGREFHYGMRIGVFSCEPMNGRRTFHVKYLHNMLHWRIAFIKYAEASKQFPLTTALTLDQLEGVQRELGLVFTRANYHLLNHNCLDFAREFIRRIAAKMPPNGKELSQEIRQPRIILPIRLVFRAERRKAIQQMDNDGQAMAQQVFNVEGKFRPAMLQVPAQQPQFPHITTIRIMPSG